MKFLNRHPVFAGAMTLFGLIIAAELWMLFAQRGNERVLEQELDRRVSAINRMQGQTPAPTDENVRRAKEDLERSKMVLTTMLEALRVAGPNELDYFKGEPANSIDAYFDISDFVERMRAEARFSGVRVAAEERFGFSAYRHAGPEPVLIRTVFRQRRVIEYLLHNLFAAHPEALIAVQRETPSAGSGAKQPSTRARSGANQPSDFLAIDPQVSARTPGYVDTMGFRVVFDGQTGALRKFMNALAKPQIPLVVRSVEVEALAGAAEGQDTASPGLSASNRSADQPWEAIPADVPIVAENSARFTVTIEMFEVAIQ